MITLLVHILNTEPIKVEVEELPSTTDTSLLGKNPRDRSDREIDWLEDGVTTVFLPWWRINYIEVLPADDHASEFPLPFRND